MKHILILCIIILFTLNIKGQKQANNWYFGDHAGLDFNTSPPTPLLNGQTGFPFAPVMLWNEGCSTISDSTGALLFYTNGMTIWNKLHQVMPNGSNLMGHTSSTQSSLIIPLPGSSRYLYVFTTDAMEHVFQNGLRYSIVDMCLDNGKGNVVSTSKNVLLVDTVTEKLISIRHSNGIDYWILVHKLLSNTFYSFKLTSAGITDTIISATQTTHYIGIGEMKASPDGLKIVNASPNDWDVVTLTGFHAGFTNLFDFDPSTGIVSNELTLPGSVAKTDYSASFSPDNSKLYFSCLGHGEVYQYDLNAGNLAAIIASKTFIIPNGPDSWRQMQLGPDNKLYLSRTAKPYISLIEFPNNPGLTCNYIDSAIYLGGKINSFGLPNFIAGFSYSNETVSCNVGISFNTSASAVNVVPNPTSDEAQIQLPENRHFEVSIIDVTGRRVYFTKNATGTIEINCSNLSAGAYFIKAMADQKFFVCKFIKQ
jgi:hypothetical protein